MGILKGMALSGFEALLGGLRTYLFSHTSNRIDVGLGTQLFAHILRLPLAYFQARRTGDTVARARELDAELILVCLSGRGDKDLDEVMCL